MTLEIRPATEDDAATIAAIWEPAWRDGHLGHVPEELVRIRSSDDFQRRARNLVPTALLAELDGEPIGFVATKGDELEQLFVSAKARGTGAADALLHAGEGALAARGTRQAWLAVASGNARARRFYERNGWVDGGPFGYAAEIEGGTIEVPCQRYVRDLDAPADAAPAS